MDYYLETSKGIVNFQMIKGKIFPKTVGDLRIIQSLDVYQEIKNSRYFEGIYESSNYQGKQQNCTDFDL